MWEAITLYNRSMDIRRLREEFAILIHSLLVHTPHSVQPVAEKLATEYMKISPLKMGGPMQTKGER